MRRQMVGASASHVVLQAGPPGGLEISCTCSCWGSGPRGPGREPGARRLRMWQFVSACQRLISVGSHSRVTRP
eukprot:13550851-Alexandrium_andersonii.AAC.1